ncbi:MAG: MerR family transcriptional regulator [Candidatus Aminicenantes bacterium]|nr:MerR family transcriptional regulator [Candidatus Aminicenantes bacterium]
MRRKKSAGRKESGPSFYHISSVSRRYDIHPQTLRLYEREGLLKPSRSEGNTRLYSEEDLKRLEVILNLIRDLGVNLAGVEVILHMRERIARMESQVGEFIDYVRRAYVTGRDEEFESRRNSLVPTAPAKIVKVDGSR